MRRTRIFRILRVEIFPGLIVLAIIASLNIPVTSSKHQLFLNEVSERGVVQLSSGSMSTEDGYILLNSPGGMECLLLKMDGSRHGIIPGNLCRILDDGSIVSIMVGIEGKEEIVKYKGRSVEWRFPATVTHEISISPIDQSIWAKGLDLDKTGNQTVKVDLILGLSSQGKEIFRWSMAEHLSEYSQLLGGLAAPYSSGKGTREEGYLNVTHMNAVQILQPNKLESSHPQFSAGNILTTDHHNGVAFIIDRKTQHIVWVHKGAQEGLHTPRWLENGHVLMFANIVKNDNQKPASWVLEIDPITHQTVWSFTEKPNGEMYCDRFGSAQRLKNGNTLISYGCKQSSIIEVTPQGSVVWKWRASIGKEKFDIPSSIYRAEWLPKELVHSFYSSQY